VKKIAAESWTKTDFDNLYQKQGINDTLKNPVSRMKIARFLDQTMQLVGNMDEQQRERVLEAAKKQVEVLPPESTSDPK
jgi:ABC-type antimicrobial peptide transport system ATPase subunit